LYSILDRVPEISKVGYFGNPNPKPNQIPNLVLKNLNEDIGPTYKRF
jgi:hypothetical protein